ncbi:MAG: MFS transporter, partial [Firmicutes bacterium]|nr:MFS transporter [Bacillota bacterium]
VASPIFGQLSDHWGRRPVAVASLLVFALADAGTALSATFPQIILSRILAGLGAAGFTPTLYAYIADRIPVSQRGRVMGITSAGLAASTFLGVPAGLALASISTWRLPFAVVAAASVLSLAVTWRIWQPNAAPSPTTSWNFRFPWEFFPNVSVTLLAYAGFGLFYTYLASYLGQAYHIRGILLAGIMLLFGLGQFIGSILLGRLGDRWGHAVVIRTGLIGQIIALMVIIMQPAVILLTLALMVFSFGGSYMPALKALISQAGGGHGEALAWNNAALYGGMAIGSVLGTQIWPAGMIWIESLAAALFLSSLALTTHLPRNAAH